MPNNLKTNYEIDNNCPLAEYPRPQFVRDSYLCLNGKWSFAIRKVGEELGFYDKQIIVPFSPESINSGLSEAVKVLANDRLYYQREVEIDKSWVGGVTLLHFGAVDYSCEVFVNGKRVGTHEGGFTSFCFNVAMHLVEGTNTITVIVTDTTHLSGGGRGKQNLNPGGYWYTAQSGIWQTVWMEHLPHNYIRAIDYIPDFEHNIMNVKIDYHGIKKYTVYDDDKVILQGETEENLRLEYNFIPWSPENPKLYNVEFVCGEDKVKSYFAMRSFSIVTDKYGKKRLGLNGKPYFFSGLLDQGYWPDGLLTYPSDQAIVDEINWVKRMGFNTLRKHIKIEPLRWYYHCDKLGIIVWQDFVNGGGEYKFANVALFPFLGILHRDDDYNYFAREDEKGRKRFIYEWQETVNQLKNCPCIYMWTVFNEGWGQFDSKKIERAVKITDPTRVVESVSGWHDYKKQCDIRSIHNYYFPLRVPKDTRPVTLSEFGGYALKVEGHIFSDDKSFSYRAYKTQAKFVNALKKLYLNKVRPLIKKGLSACIYTQVSDVEEEINGLITYDRKVAKIDETEMKQLNDALIAEANKINE